MKTLSIIPSKRLFIILISAVMFLLIPLIAMQFTEEVNWTAGDFVVGGVLLLGLGLLIEMIIRKTKNIRNRTAIIVALLIVFVLIWAELAVGIFGTPFAGS